MAARAHEASLTRFVGLALALIVTLGTVGPARADEPVAQVEDLLQRSRLGAWQLHMNVLLGVEPVDGVNAIAFGTSAELFWHGTIGMFAGLMSSKGNAQLAATDNGNPLAAPGDRISVPTGLALRPFGRVARFAGEGARGWARRLAGGLGAQVGFSVEHVRTSADSSTVPGFHLGLVLDVPLWGGPIEGGVSLMLYGRLIAAPSVTLESGAVQMPVASGQFYGGLTWTL